MQPVVTLGAAALLGLAVAWLATLAGRAALRRQAGARAREVEGEIGALRDETARLRQQLAAEQGKAARVAELEAALARRAENEDAAQDLAAAGRALARMEQGLRETTDRLRVAEEARDAALARLATLSLRAAEPEAAELRARLERAEAALARRAGLLARLRQAILES